MAVVLEWKTLKQQMKGAAMARVTINEATVDRLITDKGFAVSTSFTDRNGEQRKEKFTVWGDNSGLQVGDLLNIEGVISVRVEEFEGDNGTVRFAACHVNLPKVEKINQDGPLKTIDEFENSPF